MYEVVLTNGKEQTVSEPMGYVEATKKYDELLESYGHTAVKVVIRKARS